MSLIVCWNCGHDNPPDSLYCEECGIELNAASVDPVVPVAEAPQPAYAPVPEPLQQPAYYTPEPPQPVPVDSPPAFIPEPVQPAYYAPEPPQMIPVEPIVPEAQPVQPIYYAPEPIAPPQSAPTIDPVVAFVPEPVAPVDPVVAFVPAPIATPEPIAPVVPVVAAPEPVAPVDPVVAFVPAPIATPEPIAPVVPVVAAPEPIAPVVAAPEPIAPVVPVVAAPEPIAPVVSAPEPIAPAVPTPAVVPPPPAAIETVATPVPPATVPTPVAPAKPVTFAATVLDSEVELEEVRPATQPELAEACLVYKATGQRFDIPSEETVYVGKPNDEIAIQVDLSILPEADIISRVHAVIHHEGDNYYLEDAGSMNGTSLNQEAVRPGTRFRKLMQNGDIITFGRKRQVSFVFERK